MRRCGANRIDPIALTPATHLNTLTRQDYPSNELSIRAVYRMRRLE